MNRLNLACRCGARWTGSDTAGYITLLRGLWNGLHSGPGHEPCSSVQAGMVRRKKAVRLKPKEKDGE